MESSVSRFEDEMGDDKAYRFQHDQVPKLHATKFVAR